jgi:glutaredoxin
MGICYTYPQNEIRVNQVVLYSGSQCSNCADAKEDFKKLNIKALTIDKSMLENDDETKKFLEKINQEVHVSNVFLAGKHICSKRMKRVNNTNHPNHTDVNTGC